MKIFIRYADFMWCWCLNASRDCLLVRSSARMPSKLNLENGPSNPTFSDVRSRNKRVLLVLCGSFLRSASSLESITNSWHVLISTWRSRFTTSMTAEYNENFFETKTSSSICEYHDSDWNCARNNSQRMKSNRLIHLKTWNGAIDILGKKSVRRH